MELIYHLVLLAMASSTIVYGILLQEGTKFSPVIFTNLTAFGGDIFTVDCNLTNVVYHPVIWSRRDIFSILFIDGVPSSPDERHKFSISLNNKTVITQFKIAGVKASDAGVYECSGHPRVTFVVYLEVLPPPVYHDVIAIEKSTVNMRCPIYEMPAAMTWRRTDILPIALRDNATGSVKNMEVYEGLELVLTDVQRFDTGNYMCTYTENNGFSETNVIVLQVLYYPIIKAFQETVTVPVGKQVILSCFVDAPLHTKLIWRYGHAGPSIVTSGKYLVTEHQFGLTSTMMTLTIDSADLGDFGNYTCMALNDIGTSAATISLVQYKLFEDPLPGKELNPSFVEQVNNYTCVQGRNVTLSCKVKNIGNYKMSWVRIDNGQVLTGGTNSSTTNNKLLFNHDISDGIFISTMTIVRADREDAGTYLCQVNSDPTLNQYFFLEVFTPPVFMDNTKVFKICAKVNSTVKMRCKADGNPRPTITWRRTDGLPIILKDNSTQGYKVTGEYEGDEISISSFDIEAVYRCTAENGIGPAPTRDFKVSMKHSPHVISGHKRLAVSAGQTVNIECIVIFASCARLNWIKNNASILDTKEKYVVMQEDLGFSKTMMLLTILSATKDDLGVYTCMAENDLGTSSATVTLEEDKSTNKYF